MYANKNQKVKSPKLNNSKKSLAFKTCRHLFRKEKRKFLILLILFILCIILLIILIALQTNYVFTDNYAIVIDAGSTGTRAYLYHWVDEAGVANDDVKEQTSCKTDKLPDLYLQNRNIDLINCVNELLDKINTITFKAPIYLAATAGMRIIEIENKTLSKSIFSDIKSLFYDRGWNFKYVGIIGGRDEAISGWITANFLKNTVGKNATLRKDQFATYGILDLGGASTQIAYEAISNGEIINLYNRHYRLYARSYICHGVNMFRIRYYSEALMNPSFGEIYCFLAGAPRVMGKDSMTCRSELAKHANLNYTNKYFRPDSIKCRDQIKDMLFKSVEITRVDNNMVFVAVSSFYYFHTFLKKYYRMSGRYDSFVYATGLFCTEHYDQLKTKFAAEAKYAENYCLVGNLILVLLELYGFNKTGFENIIFTDKIQGMDVGWNLGYMIDKTRDIPDSLTFRINNIVFVIIVVLCTLFILIAIFMFLFKMWERHQKVHNVDV